jgi:hypothetical protein
MRKLFILIGIVAFLGIGYPLLKSSDSSVPVEVQETASMPVTNPGTVSDATATTSDPTWSAEPPVSDHPTKSPEGVQSKWFALQAHYGDYKLIQDFLSQKKLNDLHLKYSKMDRLSQYPEVIKVLNGEFKGDLISYENTSEYDALRKTLMNRFEMSIHFELENGVLMGNYALSATNLKGEHITTSKGKGNIDYFRFDSIETKSIVFDNGSRNNPCYFQLFPTQDGQHVAGQYFCKDVDQIKPIGYFTAQKIN